MRQLSSILLLSIHLFNLAGYTLLFRFLQQQNNKTTLEHIEKGYYSDKDLVLVKVPVTVPYSVDGNEYERIDGEIEWGGVHYNYVKRKYQNDTLYILCLPNTVQTKLRKAEKQYADHVNEAPAQKNNDTNIKKVTLSGEYENNEIVYPQPGILVPEEHHYLSFSTPLLHIYSKCIIQPPDAEVAPC